MDAVRNQVAKLVKVELNSANEKFPMFSSYHEAYAVMLEEFEEAQCELQNVEKRLNYAWVNTKQNAQQSDIDYDFVKSRAINLAVEAIQLAAMAQKTIDSMKKVE